MRNKPVSVRVFHQGFLIQVSSRIYSPQIIGILHKTKFIKHRILAKTLMHYFSHFFNEKPHIPCSMYLSILLEATTKSTSCTSQDAFQSILHKDSIFQLFSAPIFLHYSILALIISSKISLLQLQPSFLSLLLPYIDIWANIQS